MKFMGKKWILVGLVLLVLVNGVSASMCGKPLYDISNKNILESNGVKLVFIKPEPCGASLPYLENQGTKKATNMTLTVLIGGEEVINQEIADCNWMLAELGLKAGDEIMLFDLQKLHEGRHASPIALTVTSEEGATTTAEFSWPSGAGSGVGPVDPLEVIYLVLLIALPIAYVFFLFYKNAKYRKIALILFVIWGLLVLWGALNTISY